MAFKYPALQPVPLLLELLGELRLLEMFHSLLGIAAQLAEIVPHQSGHLVGIDLSPSTWVGNREQIMKISLLPCPYTLALCCRLDDSGGAEFLLSSAGGHRDM